MEEGKNIPPPPSSNVPPPSANNVPSWEPAPVPVFVAGVLTDDETQNPVVVLKSNQDERVLLMWIGDGEAQAIDLALKKVAVSRPLTHRLLANTIRGMGGTLTNIVIDRLTKGTYCASLYIRTKDSLHIIDARPSDAICLALTASCPMLVDKTLFDKASTLLQINNQEKKKAPHKHSIELSIEFVPVPPPMATDFEDESKGVAQVQKNLDRKTQPLEKQQLSPQDIERIRLQLETARLREEAP